MKVKSESEVAQSCLTLSDPTDCSLPGSSIHGIFQERVLEWGAIAFSKGEHYMVIKVQFSKKTQPSSEASASYNSDIKVCWSPITITREGNGTPLQYSCLENPMDRGTWWAAVRGVAKSQTRLSDFTLAFHFHALENEMATHSGVLAWRIPGTGEPGGLPFMGLHRVGYD